MRSKEGIVISEGIAIREGVSSKEGVVTGDSESIEPPPPLVACDPLVLCRAGISIDANADVTLAGNTATVQNTATGEVTALVGGYNGSFIFGSRPVPFYVEVPMPSSTNDNGSISILLTNKAETLTQGITFNLGTGSDGDIKDWADNPIASSINYPTVWPYIIQGEFKSNGEVTFEDNNGQSGSASSPGSFAGQVCFSGMEIIPPFSNLATIQATLKGTGPFPFTFNDAYAKTWCSQTPVPVVPVAVNMYNPKGTGAYRLPPNPDPAYATNEWHLINAPMVPDWANTTDLVIDGNGEVWNRAGRDVEVDIEGFTVIGGDGGSDSFQMSLGINKGYGYEPVGDGDIYDPDQQWRRPDFRSSNSSSFPYSQTAIIPAGCRAGMLIKRTGGTGKPYIFFHSFVATEV